MGLYRNAPAAHALFTGDVIVVPCFAPTTADPILLSDDAKGKPSPCPECKRDIPPLLTLPCPHCSKDVPSFKTKRTVSAKTRLGKLESICAVNDAQDAIASVRVVAAMILSDSCDIDGHDLISFAAVQPFSLLSATQKKEVKDRTGSWAFFHLPETDRLPEAFINFDWIFSLNRDHLGSRVEFLSSAGLVDRALMPYTEVVGGRLASLGKDGVEQMFKASIVHRTRADKVDLHVRSDIFDLDPLRPTECKSRGWAWPQPDWVKQAANARSA